MCLRKIWSRRFLDSPHHLLDGFWGPQDGFFGFSSGGYRERGAKSSASGLGDDGVAISRWHSGVNHKGQSGLFGTHQDLTEALARFCMNRDKKWAKVLTFVIV